MFGLQFGSLDEPLLLSGKDEASCEDTKRQEAWLQEHWHVLDGYRCDRCTERTHFTNRLAVYSTSPAEAAQALSAFAFGQPSPASHNRRSISPVDWLSCLRTGQSGIGHGQKLAASYPVFQEALERICDALDTHLDKPSRFSLQRNR